MHANREEIMANNTEATTSLNIESIVRDILGTIDREREREIIARRFGLFDRRETLEQIGELLGIRTNAVEVAIHRAIARLRAELERQEGSVGATTAKPDSDSAPEAERL